MVREGKVFKYKDNVDTDVIIPARAAPLVNMLRLR